ncbi:MAG: hypothetical protein J6M05_02280 [Cardiobacteriaceae bacterium]|nr:hypothetical protein [Cardiobacteriaceae bacterium]
MEVINKYLTSAKQHQEAKNTTNHYYLFDDKLVICNKDNDVIKTIQVPTSDYNGPFAKHMSAQFYQMYYEHDYLLVVVSTRWEDYWFKLYDDKLELSKEYHPWR